MNGEGAADLTGFQRDILMAVYKRNQDEEYVKGQSVRHELENRGYESVQGGHLYPELNQLTDEGYLKKHSHPYDDRANYLTLTQQGRDTLTHQLDWVASVFGLDISPQVYPESPAKPSVRH